MHMPTLREVGPAHAHIYRLPKLPVPRRHLLPDLRRDRALAQLQFICRQRPWYEYACSTHLEKMDVHEVVLLGEDAGDDRRVKVHVLLAQSLRNPKQAKGLIVILLLGSNLALLPAHLPAAWQ